MVTATTAAPATRTRRSRGFIPNSTVIGPSCAKHVGRLSRKGGGLIENSNNRAGPECVRIPDQLALGSVEFDRHFVLAVGARGQCPQDGLRQALTHVGHVAVGEDG